MMRGGPARTGPIAATLFGSAQRSVPERLARIVISAVVLGIGTTTILLAIIELPMGDLEVYLDAARRLASGQALYAAGSEPFNTYWYSPWLAVAFVPLTALPQALVTGAWLVVLLAASAAVIARLVQSGPAGLLTAGLLGPLLIAVACGGNVQPLMVAALLYRAPKKDGPLWIGLAASLKVTPILLVLPLVAARRWAASAAAVGIAVILWMPALAMGFSPGGVAGWQSAAPSLLGLSFPVYVVAVLASCVAVFAVPVSHRWLASSLAAVLALPRLFAYDVTLIGVGAASSVKRGGTSEQSEPRS